MFIKVAVRDMAPATLVLGRVGIAAIALVVFVALTLGGRSSATEFRAHWRWLVVIGLLNTALPFWLLSWGETRIDSGLASIIQASVPIFIAVLAFAIFREQRVTGARLVGVAVGFVGVALLVGAQPEGKILGALAVVGMAACYALGGLLTRRHLTGVRPQVVAAGTTAVAALALVPAGVAQAPHDAAGLEGGRVSRLPRARRHGGRVPDLVQPDRECRRALRRPRDVPRAAARAGLRRGLPRRALRRFRVRGARLILGGVALGTGVLRPSRLRRRLSARREVRDPAG